MNGMLRNPVVYDALEAYFLANPDVAVSLFRDYDDTPIFDRGWLDRYLDGLDGSYAFKLGLHADIDPRYEWFEFDPSGNIRSVPNGRVEGRALDYVTSPDFIDDVISGKADIPFDLETVIRLWGPGGAERRKAYPYEEPPGNCNAKVRRSRR